MKVNWSPLTRELAIWRGEGLRLPIWWRDDDAVSGTPALERLGSLAADLGMPVYVAAVPDNVDATLAPAVEAQPSIIPVVHGWRHLSHAPEGAKNAEFGHPREGAAEELEQALQGLRAVFADQLVPLFVPPWNRVDESFLPVLQAVGYGGFSTYGARKSTPPTAGLVQINTHIDPIFWRGHRGLVEPDTLISGLTSTLQFRRTGEVDPTEPLGLLTHHLVHTEAVWDFSRDVLQVLLDGGGIPADIGALIQAGRKPSI